MTLLKELQRRNVLRVAVLYVVASWIILQVADVLFDMFQVPPWSGRFVFILLLLGFPLVLIFAWVFEITPEGIKRESEISRSESVTHQTGRKLNVITGVLAVVAILLIAGQGFLPSGRDSAANSETSAGSASIAVLPFADMSADKNQEYFSDGISEELLNLLAKIPGLTVISRTSSFEFKGKNQDVRSIGKALGVAHVLEGSVRKAGSKVRITAQLINATNGAHLWSETYDRNLDDIFAVQDEIAGKVVEALEIRLLGNAPNVHATPQNTEAYRLLLQARHFNEMRTADGWKKALTSIDSALALEPRYAEAYVEMSRALYNLIGLGDIPLDVGLPRIRRAAERAVELDPKLPAAHAMMGSVLSDFDWDFEAAEKHIREAEALDPSNFLLLDSKITMAVAFGRIDEATRLARRRVELNPLSSAAWGGLADALARSDSLDAAVAAGRKSLDLTPGRAAAHANIAAILVWQGNAREALREIEREPSDAWRTITLPMVYAAAGMRAESDKALREAEERYADFAAYQIAEAYAFRGETEAAFKWLDRAYAQRDPGLMSLIDDPWMKKIRGDPRYKAMLRKMKLPT